MIGLRSYQDIPEKDCLPRHEEMLCEQCGEDIENIERAGVCECGKHCCGDCLYDGLCKECDRADALDRDDAEDREGAIYG